MSFISNLIARLERPTAGSTETSRRVLELCGKIPPANALFIGDECDTPQLIEQTFGISPLACFTEQHRADKAAEQGFETRVVMPYEIPAKDGGWDFIQYNGGAITGGASPILERLRSCLANGGTAVFRTLCWLIDPSPDTGCYVSRRFGTPEPLDKVLREAKEQGFKVRDFYIAPKTDWTKGLYRPLEEAMKSLEGSGEDEEYGDTRTGISEINKEIYMFDLHSEEYSYVFYILGC